MMTLVLTSIGVLIAIGFSYDVRRWVRDRWARRKPPTNYSAMRVALLDKREPNLPLSDAMRDAIRRDVSAAIDRDARTTWARQVMAFHASGHGVRKATIDALIGTVAEVARG